ncbi:cytochrome P450 1B1 [Gadus morhua]|uniref:Cytochrome P450 1A n=1 Tax=Gadus morhua TaxID=8049 RepID=A0A8C5F5P1_GADMO|nr:cytochrome P450 1B1-like [Gadus morhua]XP_030235316.1 cytochrome P450 1B1-like [Gadus morhua]
MDFAMLDWNHTLTRSLLVVAVTFLSALHAVRWLRSGALLQSGAGRRSGAQPPGPFAWPIIGNAAQMGNAPHIYFMRMAKKYGNVFQIKLGNQTVLVLNGAAIKQALVKQAPDFAGRPDFTSFRIIANGESLAFGTINDLWKSKRKVAHATVRSVSTGNLHTKHAFQNHIVCEVKELLRLFLDKTREERYFQPMVYLVVSTANIMSAVCFGKRYSYDDAEFQQVVGRNDQFTKTVGAGSMVDVMPWLQYFPNPIKSLFEDFKTLNYEFNIFIGKKVTEHRKTIESSTIRDMTDALIVAMDHIRDPTKGVSVQQDHVPPTVADVFGASQDTLSTALSWIILILVRFPEMQRCLQEEVDKVVDRESLPSIEDQPRLSYVMAFVYEVMRYTSFVPLTIPHSTTADTVIMGYSVPKDRVVFINQWSINHDPEVWSEPGAFQPTRFLRPDGSLNKDLVSNVMIFSLGKRRCIGEDLSKMQLFLFTALLAHQCHLRSDPAHPPQMDYSYGLTLKPLPFSIEVELRDDMSLLDEFCRP